MNLGKIGSKNLSRGFSKLTTPANNYDIDLDVSGAMATESTNKIDTRTKIMVKQNQSDIKNMRYAMDELKE